MNAEKQELTAFARGRTFFQRPRVRAIALVVVALAAAATAWLVTGLVRSDDTQAIFVDPVGPVGLSADGLRDLAVSVGQPIYWAGAKEGYLYELTRHSNGDVFVRYLPPGVDVGDDSSIYLTIGTHPHANALDALQGRAGEKLDLPNGGVAVVDADAASRVELAYPGIDYEVDIVDATAAGSLEVARSGDVRPVG